MLLLEVRASSSFFCGAGFFFEILFSAPRPNEPIISPLAISSEARGPWFFEATFPVLLLDVICIDKSILI